MYCSGARLKLLTLRDYACPLGPLVLSPLVLFALVLGPLVLFALARLLCAWGAPACVRGGAPACVRGGRGGGIGVQISNKKMN